MNIIVTFKGIVFFALLVISFVLGWVISNYFGGKD